MTLPRNIVLVGFMGTGKSVVGRALAERLGRTFVDLDAVVEERADCSIAVLFETEGEAGFRKRERAAVNEVAARSGQVVATGGGVVLDPDNLRALAATGDIVCLTAKPETIWVRVGGDSGRPLLRGSDPIGKVRELLSQRAPIYDSIPIQVSTDDRDAAAVADEVLRHLSPSR